MTENILFLQIKQNEVQKQVLYKLEYTKTTKVYSFYYSISNVLDMVVLTKKNGYVTHSFW